MDIVERRLPAAAVARCFSGVTRTPLSYLAHLARKDTVRMTDIVPVPHDGGSLARRLGLPCRQCLMGSLDRLGERADGRTSAPEQDIKVRKQNSRKGTLVS